MFPIGSESMYISLFQYNFDDDDDNEDELEEHLVNEDLVGE